MTNKKYYLPFLLILIIVVIVYILLPKSNQPSPSISPSSTSILPTKIVVSPSPIPTLIPPAPFTGVMEITLPQPTVDMIQQKQNLRLKTPLEEMYFTITFDYGEDKFIVDLKEPKEVSQKEFNQWLSTNYPLIPTDRFIIK